MLLLTDIAGNIFDPALQAKVHALEHAGAVETLTLPQADMARKRLRAVSDRGTPCAIAIPRDATLTDGAVFLVDGLAVIIRAEAQHWLRLIAKTPADALELGYQAGNLHWRVRFDGADLLVAIEGPAQRYLERIRHLADAGRVSVVLGESAAA